jgi:hypothetical protein
MKEHYLIITPNGDKTIRIEGNYPSTLLDLLAEDYDRLIVVSYYSNTVKFLKRTMIEDCWGEHLTFETIKENTFKN